MQADDPRPRLKISSSVFAIENGHLDHVGRLQGEISNGSGTHFPQVENSILHPRVDPNRMRPWLVSPGRLRACYEKLRISCPLCMDHAVSVRAVARCIIPD